MDIDQRIEYLKMQLLRKAPFYGDILTRLPLEPSRDVPTAATDGRRILYNRRFMESLSDERRLYVLLHEVLHVVYDHAGRKRNYDPEIWNVACDAVINATLDRMKNNMMYDGIPIDRPENGIYLNISPSASAESVYAELMEANPKRKPKKTLFGIGGKSGAGTTPVELPGRMQTGIYSPREKRYVRITEVKPADDLLPCEELSEEEAAVHREQLAQMVREAADKARGCGSSIPIPDFLYEISGKRPLDWKKLLRDYLEDEISDETSYATPERKYLHMGLILPGHGTTAERLEEIWAFVDSSGSVGHEEMEAFLTQLYAIAREFHCVMNIAYWDTSVTDVYRNIRSESEIKNCIPHHSGGTNINCIYEWIDFRHVKPPVMLILTDGYYGSLQTWNRKRRLAEKTLLILSTDIPENPDMKRIGRVVRLKP